MWIFFELSKGVGIFHFGHIKLVLQPQYRPSETDTEPDKTDDNSEDNEDDEDDEDDEDEDAGFGNVQDQLINVEDDAEEDFDGFAADIQAALETIREQRV